MGTIGAEAAAPLLDSVRLADDTASAGDTALVRGTVGTEEMVGAVGALRSAAGFPLGGFLALRSRSAEMAPFTRLRRMIFYAFGGGLVLALLSSLVLAGQITRPVRALVAATDKVREGQYSVRVAVRSRDEIGDLARAFDHMLKELRDKQQLVDYLQSAGERTVPLSTAGGEITEVRRAPRPSITGVLETGQVLADRYEVKALLGQGGMGMVYRAFDRQLGEMVALKTLRPELASDSTTLERFKQEIRLARRITHRNVVRTHDLGEVDGMYFITMEYVAGTNLKDLIKQRGKLPVGVTFTIGKQLCRALEVAHEQQVIPGRPLRHGRGAVRVPHRPHRLPVTVAHRADRQAPGREDRRSPHAQPRGVPAPGRGGAQGAGQEAHGAVGHGRRVSRSAEGIAG